MLRWLVACVAVGVAQGAWVAPPVEYSLFGSACAASGGATLVGARGVEAMLANPACCPGSGGQVALGYLDLSHRRATLWATALAPVRGWWLCPVWAVARVGDVELRDEAGALLGSSSWAWHKLGVGVARKLDFFTAVGLRAFALRIDGLDEGWGWGADLGVVRWVLPPLLGVGAAVHDLFSTTRYHGGIREDVGPRVSVAAQVGLWEGRLQMEWNAYSRTGSGEWRGQVGLRAHLGALVLRLGYHRTGLSVGCSILADDVGLGLAAVRDPMGGIGRGVEVTWTRSVEP